MSYAVLAREFPDYDQATLPAIPAHWIESAWHNDACPSFVIGDDSGLSPGIQVFIDYADPKRSEFPEWRADGRMHRFNAMNIQGDGTAENDVTSADDWQELLAGLIAWQFAQNLRASFTPAAFELMQQRNREWAAEGKTDVCASHDFCDANMPMSDAFEWIIGRPVLTAPDGSEEHENDCKLWSRAWHIATPLYLTAKVN